MKIFHIVSNKEWGGGEQYVYDLSLRQRADSIDVTIFCKPVEDIIRKYTEAGMQVIPLPLGGALDVKSAWQMAAIINKEGTCTIHAHNFKDAFTACYARKLSSNKNVRNPTINPNKLGIVHTSIVVPENTVPVDVRKEFNIPETCTVAMFHGRLDPEKGIDTLMDAVEQIKEKDFKLVLIGKGSDEYTEHLKTTINSKGIAKKIIFAGFRHPVLPYVAGADFGILASTVREGCPLSPQEYMSQGRPVIVTNNGGQREYVVQEQNGLLVPPGDVKALADAIARMVDDVALRQRLGQQAKADFDDHLNYTHYYDQIKTIYNV